MSKQSKTARASMTTAKVEKKVIPDDVLIKNLRNEVASGLYPTIQGSHALLREFDKLLAYTLGVEANNLKMQAKIAALTELNEALRYRAADADKYGAQLDELAQFILELPGEPSQSEGAVDTAIRLLKGVYDARAAQVTAKAIAEAPYADQLTTLDGVNESQFELDGSPRQL